MVSIVPLSCPVLTSSQWIFDIMRSVLVGGAFPSVRASNSILSVSDPVPAVPRPSRTTGTHYVLLRGELEAALRDQESI